MESKKTFIEKSRLHLLDWLTKTFNKNVGEIESLYSGAEYCNMLHKLFPGSFNIKKVKLKAMCYTDCCKNFELFEDVLRKVGCLKHIPIEKLVEKKPRESLEFLQWFYEFYEKNKICEEKEPSSSDQKHTKDMPNLVDEKLENEERNPIDSGIVANKLKDPVELNMTLLDLTEKAANAANQIQVFRSSLEKISDLSEISKKIPGMEKFQKILYEALLQMNQRDRMYNLETSIVIIEKTFKEKEKALKSEVEQKCKKIDDLDKQLKEYQIKYCQEVELMHKKADLAMTVMENCELSKQKMKKSLKNLKSMISSRKRAEKKIEDKLVFESSIKCLEYEKKKLEKKNLVLISKKNILTEEIKNLQLQFEGCSNLIQEQKCLIRNLRNEKNKNLKFKLELEYLLSANRPSSGQSASSSSESNSLEKTTAIQPSRSSQSTPETSSDTPAAAAAASSIQLSDLQNILSGLSVRAQVESSSRPSVDLSSAITAEALQPLFNNQDLMDRVRSLLPPSSDTSSPVASDELCSTVQSPQFQQIQVPMSVEFKEQDILAPKYKKSMLAFDSLFFQEYVEKKAAPEYVTDIDEKQLCTFVDHECYEKYLKIQGDEKIDYRTYLSIFYQLYDIPKEKKNSEYEKYLECLLKRLEEYCIILKPALDVNEEMKSASVEFEEDWKTGTFPGWQNEKIYMGSDFVDLSAFSSWEELSYLGLDRLKSALMALGLKFDGTLEQICQRLFETKGQTLDSTLKSNRHKEDNKDKQIARLESKVYCFARIISEPE